MRVFVNLFRYYRKIYQYKSLIIVGCFIVFGLSFLQSYMSLTLFNTIINYSQNKEFIFKVTFLIVLNFFVLNSIINFVKNYLEVEGSEFLNYCKEEFFELYAKIEYSKISETEVANNLELSKQLLREETFLKLNYLIIDQLSILFGIFGIWIFFFTKSIEMTLVLISLSCVPFFFYRKSIENQFKKYQMERDIFRKERYYNYILQEKKFMKHLRNKKRENHIFQKFKQDNDEMFNQTIEYFVKKQLKIDSKIKLFEYMQFILVNIILLLVSITLGLNVLIFTMLVKANYDLSEKIKLFLLNLSETVILLKLYELYYEFVTDNQYVSSEQFTCDKIVFENVSFASKDYLIIDNISTSISKHNNYTIVGLNGSGKTTFALLLVGLLKPTKGQIKYFFEEQEVYNTTVGNKLPNSSILFQDFKYFDLSVHENIGQSIEKKQYSELLFDIDLEASDFSLGQKQRIAMVRALNKKASILLLDEPSASLDEETTTIFSKVYRKVRHFPIKLLITHDLENIDENSKIIAFKKGRICYEGIYRDDLFE
ncbi:MAG: ATP-binding cassette domain-containing protein [Mycoplasmatales bacterium]